MMIKVIYKGTSCCSSFGQSTGATLATCGAILWWIAALAVSSYSASAQAGTSDAETVQAATQDVEARWQLPPAITNNLRFTLDFSSRTVDFTSMDETGFQHAVGFDSYKVVSGESHDIGTLILQGYLTRIDNLIKHPPFFEDDEDTEFVFRIFNFNYSGLGGPAPNIRVGHFEVPFGLEHSINTNGTLRQYIQPRNLGIKADWGVALNKQYQRLEYEVGLSTGGGQSLDRDDGSFVFASRVGTPRDENRVLGASLYRSRLGGIIRSRLGLDGQFYFGRNGILTEISVGENNDEDVLNGLLEWNRRNRTETWLYYAQLAYFSQDMAGTGQSASLASLGIRFQPTNRWVLSSQYSRDLDTFSSASKGTQFVVQARFRL